MFKFERKLEYELFSENGLMSPMFGTYNPRSQDMANVIYLDRDEEKEEIQV